MNTPSDPLAFSAMLGREAASAAPKIQSNPITGNEANPILPPSLGARISRLRQSPAQEEVKKKFKANVFLNT